MKTVTILGQGAMGSRIAINLLKHGYNLNVWNRSPEACNEAVALGAKQYSTPKESVKDADFVIAMLTDDVASRDVWLNETTGAVFGLKQNAIAIESSTLSLAWCLELSEIIKNHEAAFLDAPVVGSRPQADASQLIYLVGGDEIILKQAHELLSVNSSAIHHIGANGTGMSMKLAINGLFGIQVSALSEMLGMLEKLGTSKDVAVKLLNELPTTSPALKGIGLAIASENYDPLFPINLVEKDFSYLQQMSTSQGSDTPIANNTREVFSRAIDKGYGKNNIAGVVQLYL